MDNRIDAIYGRQSIDKKDSISIESQFEFCRYELKGGEGKEYKDKGYSGKNIERPDFQRLLQDIRLGLIKRPAHAFGCSHVQAGQRQCRY